MQTLSIDGPLNIYNVEALQQQLDDKLAAQQDIAVDLSHVSEMDATGLQCLLYAQRELAAAEHHLLLQDPSPTVVQLLGLCGCDALLASARFSSDSATQ